MNLAKLGENCILSQCTDDKHIKCINEQVYEECGDGGICMFVVRGHAVWLPAALARSLLEKRILILLRDFSLDGQLCRIYHLSGTC